MSAADMARHLSGRPDIAADLERKYESDAKHDAERDRFELWFLEQKTSVTHACPPIPSRAFDWLATFADYDEGGPVGCGATCAEAFAALKEIAWEREMDK